MTCTPEEVRTRFEAWVSAQSWFAATLGLASAHTGEDYADPCINSRWQGWVAAYAAERDEGVSLGDAIRALEGRALIGVKLHGDDVPRLRSITERLTSGEPSVGGGGFTSGRYTGGNPGDTRVTTVVGERGGMGPVAVEPMQGKAVGALGINWSGAFSRAGKHTVEPTQPADSGRVGDISKARALIDDVVHGEIDLQEGLGEAHDLLTAALAAQDQTAEPVAQVDRGILPKRPLPAFKSPSGLDGFTALQMKEYGAACAVAAQPCAVPDGYSREWLESLAQSLASGAHALATDHRQLGYKNAANLSSASAFIHAVLGAPPAHATEPGAVVNAAQAQPLSCPFCGSRATRHKGEGAGSRWEYACPHGHTGYMRLKEWNTRAFLQHHVVEMSPEFTDSSRGAIAWVLYHHQGQGSATGEALRFALGLGAHEPLPDHLVKEAKRWAELSGATTRQFHPTGARAVPAELARLSGQAIEDWAVVEGKVSGGSVVGGPIQNFARGSGQTQIASFSVPRLPDNDPRNPADLQLANTAFAVACVQYVRSLLATAPSQGEPS